MDSLLENKFFTNLYFCIIAVMVKLKNINQHNKLSVRKQHIILYRELDITKIKI